MKPKKPKVMDLDAVKAIGAGEDHPPKVKISGAQERQGTAQIEAAIRAMASSQSSAPLLTKLLSVSPGSRVEEEEIDAINRELAAMQEQLLEIFDSFRKREATEQVILNNLDELTKSLSEFSESKRANAGPEATQTGGAAGGGGGRQRGDGQGGAPRDGRGGGKRGGGQGGRRQKSDNEKIDDQQQMINAMQDLVQKLSNPGPRVRITHQDLEVNYVISDAEKFIGDGEKEERKWIMVASLCLGAAFGIVVNWVTSVNHEISALSQVAIIVFLVNGGLALSSARQAQRRTDDCRERTKGPKRQMSGQNLVKRVPQGKSKKSKPTGSGESTL